MYSGKFLFGVTPRCLTVDLVEGLRTLRNERGIRRWLVDSEEVSEAQQAAWFDTYVRDDSQALWVYQNAHAQVVGAVSIYNIDYQLMKAEFGRLMASTELSRPRRLGEMLAKFAIEQARSLGLGEVYLHVFQDNSRAIQIYEALGFVMTSNKGKLSTMRLTLSSKNHYSSGRRPTTGGVELGFVDNAER